MTTYANKFQVCFVEDSKTAAFPVKKFLDKLPEYDYQHFKDAESALASIQQQKYDLLITDLTLSATGMNGIDLIKALRQNPNISINKIPILVATGSQDDQVLLDVFNAGANDYLIKPLNFKALEARMKNYASKAHHKERQSNSQKNGLICLIEDSRTAAHFLSKALETEPFTIEHYLSAEAALEVITTKNYDIILSDLNLAEEGLDGDEFVQTLRRLKNPVISQTPCIIITGDTSDETINKVFHAGANDYLAKPVKAKELIARLHAMLERRSEFLNRHKAKTNAQTKPASKPKSELKLEDRQEQSIADALEIDFSNLSIEEPNPVETKAQPQSPSKKPQPPKPNATPKTATSAKKSAKANQPNDDFADLGNEFDQIAKELDQALDTIAEAEANLPFPLDEQASTKKSVPPPKTTKKASQARSQTKKTSILDDEPLSIDDIDVLSKANQTSKTQAKSPPQTKTSSPFDNAEIEQIEIGEAPQGFGTNQTASPKPTPPVKSNKKIKIGAHTKKEQHKKPKEDKPNIIIRFFAGLFRVIGKLMKWSIYLALLAGLMLGLLIAAKQVDPKFKLPFELPFRIPYYNQTSEADEDDSYNEDEEDNYDDDYDDDYGDEDDGYGDDSTTETNLNAIEEDFDTIENNEIKNASPNNAQPQQKVVNNPSTSPEIRINIPQQTASSISNAQVSSAKKGFMIAEEARNRLRGYGQQIADMILIINKKHGETTKHQFSYISKEISQSLEQSLLVIVKSDDIKGTALLTKHREKLTDQQFLYIPAIRRATKISENNQLGSFAGSEFSYLDLNLQALYEFDYQLIKSQTYNGKNCFVIKAKPKMSANYAYEERWIDKDAFRTLKKVYYNNKKQVIKIYTANQFKGYLGKHWRAGEIVMTNKQNGNISKMVWLNYRFNVNISEADFDLKTLSQRIK